MRFKCLSFLSMASLCVVVPHTKADGPADNIPGSVRRIPKLGIELKADVKKELEEGLEVLKQRLALVPYRDQSPNRELVPDILIFYKAVRDALVYQEFFTEQDIQKARELLEMGKARCTILTFRPEQNWTNQAGLVVRGYSSKIDASVQPYGLVIPDGPMPANGYRLDLWFHGRGETLSEVNFLDDRRKKVGEFAPPGTIVLHPYGRYCNANKFAGEVDALEAIESVKSHYKIDPDRISVRGFSMGGAACWHFAVHFSDRWFAANPGAGFAETPKFLNVFQRETLTPTWYEQKLWHLYDCTDVAENLAQCPTVAYSGELDTQKQAADVMAEALAKHKIDLLHVIGPKTKHAYQKDAKLEVERRLESLAEVGRKRIPEEVWFGTYTLKYNRMNWVTIDAMGEHWEKAEVHARLKGAKDIEVTSKNVTAMTLDFPSGYSPFPLEEIVNLSIDGSKIAAGRPKSDHSWTVSIEKLSEGWALKNKDIEGLRKRHNLQGPIDDAFMDSFMMVKPTGKSKRPKVQGWVEQELARAIEHWRRHFRGEARVKNDVDVTSADIASHHLILWGDPDSNTLIKRLAEKLPIGWDSTHLKVGDQDFDAENYAPVLIYPNPLNPDRYIVLNSGFTFRDYDYLNNARQVPKLPDWAVVDLRTPPNSRFPGKIAAADFFGEKWGLKPRRPGP